MTDQPQTPSFGSGSGSGAGAGLSALKSMADDSPTAGAPIDYNSLDFTRGYECGYLGEVPAALQSASYLEGRMIGEAEQDASQEFVRPELYAARQRKLMEPSP